MRNVDEALRLILAGSALLLVIAGLGFTLISTGSVPRLGRSHLTSHHHTRKARYGGSFSW